MDWSGPGTNDGLQRNGWRARILNRGMSLAPDDLNVAILRRKTSVSAISRRSDDHIKSSGTVSPGDSRIITVAETRTTAGGGRDMDASATRFERDRAADRSGSFGSAFSPILTACGFPFLLCAISLLFFVRGRPYALTGLFLPPPRVGSDRAFPP